MKTLHYSIIAMVLVVAGTNGVAFGQNFNDYFQETFPHNSMTTKVGYHGAEIVINQTMTKTVYKSGEPIPVNRTLANVGNHTGYVSYPWPFFGYITLDQNGAMVRNVTRDSGIYTINDAITIPAKSYAVAYYQADDPYALRISHAGNYTIATYSILDVYSSDPPLGQKPDIIKSVILLSKPMMITILPEKYDQSKTIPKPAENDTFSPGDNMTQVPSLEMLIDHQLMHNPLYLIIETKIPGFGGAYMDDSRTLNICLTNPIPVNASDLSAYFLKEQLVYGVKINQCKYSYMQLMQLEDIMSQLSNDKSLGVTIMTGWDEKNQVYNIGLHKVDDAKTFKINQFLISHHIPTDLVRIQEVDLEPIPEFPFVVPLLLIGITASIVFYRMKIRK